MSASLEIAPGLPAVLVALACLVGGAAWFADALRALRLRRAWSGASERTPGTLHEGTLRVAGRVSLTGPLFSPLGGRPCAGFVLDVQGVGERVCGRVCERRAFDLGDGAEAARVEPDGAVWTLPVSNERTFAAGEPLGARLEALLDREPELAWLRRRGGALRVVERALHHGDRVTVLAAAYRVEHVAEVPTEWLATGTDGAVAAAGPREITRTAEWTLASPDGFALQLAAAGLPEGAVRLPANARTWGTVLGPALALAGLLALARLAGAAWGGH